MYLDWRGEWELTALNGIATAPLLQNDGRSKAPNMIPLRAWGEKSAQCHRTRIRPAE
jgi:hypothetical protein